MNNILKIIRFKKTAGVTFLLLVMMQLLSFSFAAEGDVLWSKSYDGGDGDYAYDVATDSNNNIIVTGPSVGTNYNCFTIKYGPNGNVLWGRSYDGGGGDYAYGVATDSNNNIIITGTTRVGTNSKYYTIKYDPGGNVLWSKSYDAGNSDVAEGVATDSGNNIIVTGASKVGTNYNYYTIKYDPNGNVLWNRSYDGGKDDWAKGITTDSDNNIIVTGRSLGTNDNYYTIKYDPNGNVLWGRSYDGGGGDYAYGVATDSNNNIIVTGQSLGTNSNCYTIKYDPNGNVLWSRSYDGGSYDSARSVATDSDNNIIVTGTTHIGNSDDYYTVKYDHNGNALWSKTYDEGNNEGAYGVATDSDNNIIVTGWSNVVGYDSNYYTIKYEGSPSIKTISGTIHYENRIFNEIGTGDPNATEFKPVRFADVEVFNQTTGATLASGETNADGTYDITVNARNNDVIILKCYAYQENANYNIQVVDSQGNKHSVVTPNTVVTASDISLNLDISEANNAGAFNILDTIMRGSDKVKELNGTVPPLITVRWWKGYVPKSGTSYSYNIIDINGSSDDSDEYDDSVILHEYGHFVSDEYSYNKTPGGSHKFNDTNQDIRLSWSEGWATYFSCLVRNNPFYIDVGKDQQGNFWYTSLNIETLYDSDYGPLMSTTGQDTETAVSSILWDIYDATDDAGDTVSLGAQPIWGAFHTLNDSYDCVLEDFYNGFFSNASSGIYRSQVNNIFAERKVFYSTPLFKRGKIFTKLDNRNIPNGGGQSLDSSLTIADNLSIENLNVFIDLPHRHRSDLLLKLISPSKKEVILHNHTSPQSGQPEGIFVWYQPPYETIPDGNMPGTGQDITALDIFKDEDAQGSWILKIQDVDAHSDNPELLNNGNLNRWKLEIRENQPPVFNPIGDKVVDEGKLLEFSISATDPNNQTLTYSATGLPQGAYFSSEKRLFSWLPNYNQQGEYTVRFEVTNGLLKDAEEIKIIVNDVKITGVSGSSVEIGIKVRVIQ